MPVGRWEVATYPGTVNSGRAFFVYSGLRLVLLLAVGGLLYLTGARGLLLIVLAFVVSGALSLVWLDRPRAQMSAGVGRAIGRVNERIDHAAQAEDLPDEDDAGDQQSLDDGVPTDETHLEPHAGASDETLEGESHAEPQSGQK